MVIMLIYRLAEKELNLFIVFLILKFYIKNWVLAFWEILEIRKGV